MKVLHKERTMLVECLAIDKKSGVITILHPVTGKETRAPVELYNLDVNTQAQVKELEASEEKKAQENTERNRQSFINRLIDGEPEKDYVWCMDRLYVLNGDADEFRAFQEELRSESNYYMRSKMRAEMETRFRSYHRETIEAMFAHAVACVGSDDEEREKVLGAAAKCLCS